MSGNLKEITDLKTRGRVASKEYITEVVRRTSRFKVSHETFKRTCGIQILIIFINVNGRSHEVIFVMIGVNIDVIA